MSGVGAERFHALDAVRGGVLMLGVLFHATLSFLPGPQIWLVMDASRSTELSVLFFVLHIFRMTVFFVLAGFFARLLLERRGVGGFIANRAKRIAHSAGHVLADRADRVHRGADLGRGASQWRRRAGRRAAAAADGRERSRCCTCGFLYVLLFFYAAALVLRGVVHLIDRSGALRARLVDPLVRLIAGPAAPVLLAIPVAAALYFTPNWMTWFGIPTPDTRPHPEHDRADHLRPRVRLRLADQSPTADPARLGRALGDLCRPGDRRDGDVPRHRRRRAGARRRRRRA